MNRRLIHIADAATVLFIRQGYARTQISHIAKAAGISVGTVYLDFAGKKEILHFILKRTIDPAFPSSALKRPVTDALFAGLEDEIVAHLDQTALRFADHVQNGKAACDVETLIGDAFDLLSQYAVGCLLIEKNQADFAALAPPYRQARASLFATMERCFRAFIDQGSVRPVENVELTVTLIVELLSWWAMDVRYATFIPRDIPPALAKQTCMDNILAAYRR